MAKKFKNIHAVIAKKKMLNNSNSNEEKKKFFDFKAWKKRNYNILSKVSSAFAIISATTSTINLMAQNKFKLFNNLYVASTIVETAMREWLLEYSEIYQFLPENCISFSQSLNKEILELLSSCDKKLFAHNGESKYFEIKLKDTVIIQIFDSRYGNKCYLYCEQKYFDNIKKYLSELFWKKYDTVISVMPEEKIKFYDNEKCSDSYNSPVIFKKIDKIVGFYPKQYYEFFEYIDKFKKNDISRSIVLYGAPGTGKTVLSKLITQEMGLKTVHINVNDIGVSSYSIILNFVDLFCPEVIVIDDFDRIKETDSLLPLIEELHKKLKIIIVSVNNKDFAKDNLALIRPERFDKFIEVKTIDEKVALQLFGEDNKEFFDRIKDYPAAFIKEAGTSIRILGKENANQILSELDERIKAQNDKYNY